MRPPGTPSWQLRVNPWPTELVLALWIRAVERIPVPSGGLVPGPVDLDPLPAPSEPPLDPDQVADGWAHWWAQLVDVAPPDPRIMALATEPDLALESGASPWLLPWPDLHRVVGRRVREAARWRHERTLVAMRDLDRTPPRDDGDVVRQLEADLHRAAPSFECELIVLPVCDDVVRQIAPGRYLVPERVYDDAAWPATLTQLIRPLFG